MMYKIRFSSSIIIIIIIIIALITLLSGQEELWVRVYSESDNWGAGGAIFVLEDGNYLIVGTQGGYDGFLILKIDENGNPLWTKKYQSYMEPFEIRLLGISKIPSNIFACFSNSNFFLFNDNGDSLFLRNYDEIIAFGYALALANGHFILGGLSPTCYDTIRIVQIDSTGDVEWITNLPYGEWSLSPMFKQSIYGGYFLIRWHVVIKFSEDGDIIWMQSYHTYCRGIWDLIESLDGNIILVGGGRPSPCVLKIHGPTGGVMHSSYLTEFYDTTVYNRGAVTCISQTYDGNFVLGVITFNVFTSWAREGWIIKIDTFENILWAQPILYPGINNIFWLSEILQLQDSSYLAVGTATVPDDSYQVCLVKLRIQDTANIREQQNKLQFLSIFPSPFNSSCIISAPAGSDVEIYDVNGRLVWGSPIYGVLGDNIQRGDLSPRSIVWTPDESVRNGVYLVRAKIGEQVMTKRVVLIR